jgi:hypothetical protein
MEYLIRSLDIVEEAGEHLFWSCKYGWVDVYTADTFSQQEKDTLALPIAGEWVLCTEIL